MCRAAVLTILVVVATVALADDPVSGPIYAFGRVNPKYPAIQFDSPEKSPVLEGKKFRSVAAGPVAIGVILPDEGGSIMRLDDPTSKGNLISPSTSDEQWCQMCKGDIHTVAVTCKGHAYMWGGRSQMIDPDGPVFPGIYARKLLNERVIQISCARNHTLMLTEFRDVYVFGSTSSNRLGIEDLPPTQQTQYEPVKLRSLSQGQLLGDDSVCFVSAGGRSSYAVTEGGDMFVWGANEFGQLGTGELSESVATPTLVDTKFRACEISAGDDFAIAYDIDGQFWGWGANVTTPTLHGTSADTSSWASRLDSPPMMLASGQFHAAILLTNGSVFTLGYNRYGQLGVNLGGDPNSVEHIWTLKPQLVEYLADKNISAIYAAGNYTLAHSFMKSPMNCQCARGGREKFNFGVPGAKPFFPTSPVPVSVAQPAVKPSDLFAPLAPNRIKPRNRIPKPLPDEVISTPPPNMDNLPDHHRVQSIANNILKVPELAPSVAKTIIYPPATIDAKLWAGKAGPLRAHKHNLKIFGKFVTNHGYFYGDDIDTDTIPIPAETNLAAMPAVVPTQSQSLEIADDSLDEYGAKVFSLSLQDVKMPRSESDTAILDSRKQNEKDPVQEGYPAPVFDDKTANVDWTDTVSTRV